VGVYINNDAGADLSPYKAAAAVCEAVLSHEECISAEIGITFVTDEVMRRMNLAYRNKDRVTDVLSFNLDLDPEGRLCGDIFISLDQAVRQAADIGHSPAREVYFLIVHGTLHLLGHDHGDVMMNKQKEIMSKIMSSLAGTYE